MTTTKKEILKYLTENNNLNNFELEKIHALDLENIALSFGTYGMNAGLFQSRVNGNYYVIPTRSTMLFRLV
jgi:hypothetical protein